MTSVQNIPSNKKIEPNPQTSAKSLPFSKTIALNLFEKQMPKKEQNSKAKDMPAQDKELNALKNIKSAELFFTKKFLGQKDQSKAIMIKNLLKMPKQLQPQKIIELKTGNLCDKMKEIEKIFKAQKKDIKNKKSFIPPVMTDFEMYMTKRDILKEKKQIIDLLRVEYEEDKKKLQMKKTKKKRRFSIEEVQAQKQDSKTKSKPELQKKEPIQEQLENQKIGQLLFPSLYEETYSPPREIPAIPQINQNQTLQPSESQQVKKQEQKIEVVKPFDDEYFQKKFQEKIVKNTVNVEANFSLKSLFKSFDKRKTTLNEAGFIKNELNQIQQVAKATIENFEVKQKVNRQLYGQNADFDKIESEWNSKRQTPTELFSDEGYKTERKQIGWILKECDSFKKRFNIRKAKSMKTIKK